MRRLNLPKDSGGLVHALPLVVCAQEGFHFFRKTLALVAASELGNVALLGLV